MLNEFSTFCRAHAIRLIFVFTPNTYNASFRKKYDLLIPLLEKAGIEYLDLYPLIYKKFNGTNTRLMWANPVNGHPGDIVTSVYADEVFAYLKVCGVLSQK